MSPSEHLHQIDVACQGVLDISNSQKLGRHSKKMECFLSLVIRNKNRQLSFYNVLLLVSVGLLLYINELQSSLCIWKLILTSSSLTDMVSTSSVFELKKPACADCLLKACVGYHNAASSSTRTHLDERPSD